MVSPTRTIAFFAFENSATADAGSQHHQDEDLYQIATIHTSNIRDMVTISIRNPGFFYRLFIVCWKPVWQTP